MQIPFNGAFVGWAVKAVGGVDRFRQLLEQEMAPGRGTSSQREYFRMLSAGVSDHSPRAQAFRGRWRRAFAEPLNCDAIADILRIVGPYIEILPRFAPWDRLPSGRFTVHVALGVRTVDIPEVASMVRQRAVGYRDSEALAELMEFLHGVLRLDCRVELHHAADEAAAEAKLKTLAAKPDAGLIVCIGSPVVNPFANPIGRMILDQGDGRLANLPAKFRFAFSHPRWLLAEPPEKSRSAWGSDEEGIRFPDRNGVNTCRRVSDDEIWKQAAPVGPFGDAGLLLMDLRNRPLLVLCAGHGGCGTLGAIRQLRAFDKLATLAEYFMGKTDLTNRICAVIDVQRQIDPVMADAGASPALDTLMVASAQVCWPQLPSDPTPRNYSSPRRRTI